MDEFSLLRELIDMVKNLSPTIWESARRQVFVSALTSLIWAACGLAVGLSCVRVAKFSWRKLMEPEREKESAFEAADRKTGWGFAFGLSVIGVLVFLSMGISYVVEATQLFYAPDYHAIRLLLKMVR